jgi:hypothetical protein
MPASHPQLETTVALFVFNRPAPTRQVFAAIRAARPTRLLVVADGPRASRGAAEARACAEVREIVGQVDWPCEVGRLYADENLGCGARLSSGLDWVFASVEEAIILEDDCLPAPAFFPFCTAMLERYRDDARIAMVAGTNYLSEPARTESYLFSRYYAIWGWATWRRAWRAYDIAMPEWPRLRAERAVHGLYAEPGLADAVTAMFDDAYAGRVDTWDIQWFHACLFNHALAITPRVNLVRNIGLDGTRPAGAFQEMATGDLDVSALRHPPLLTPDLEHEARLYDAVLRPAAPGWRARAAQRLPAPVAGAVRRAAIAAGRPLR